ncbi:MAG: response regulator [Anaerolineaceae bacterium]|nr:response regulator [Anaerolineaceae bacterium]
MNQTRPMSEEQIALQDRVKELNCIYSISKLAFNKLSLPEILQRITNLIPPAFRNPEITCARLQLDGNVYVSDNFQETEWRQISEINMNGQHRGGIEIFLLEEPTANKDGAFLPYEQLLISSIAERSVKVAENKLIGKRMTHLNLTLSAIRNINQLLVREKKSNVMIQEACNILIQEAQFSTAWIALLDQSGNKLIANAESGFGGNFSFLKERLILGDFPDCVKLALEQPGLVNISNPTDTCADCQITDLYTKNNRRIIRLEHEGNIFGILAVSDMVDFSTAQEESSLFEEIAGDIGLGLHNIRQNQLLRETEARMKLGNQGSKTGLWDLNIKTGEISRDAYFVKMLGYQPEEMPLLLSQTLHHPDDWKKVLARLKACITGEKELFISEHRILHKSGRYIWFLVFGQIFERDEEGNPTRLIGTAQDVSDQKHHEQQLIEAKEEAEVSARAKSQFLATMSHEIRTPMNGVIGMASLLNQTKVTAEQKEYVDTIRLSGESLLIIINDILDFSKIDSGQMELEETDYNLRNLIEEALELLGGLAAKKKLDLLYSIDPTVSTNLVGDPTRLRQVIVNLLSNAIKFTEKGEVFLKVTKNKKQPDHIQIDVSDTGIGLAPEEINRLFKAFSQADASTTRKFGGTGLGLAISKQLVNLMEGDIWVTSKIGEGSTFSFTIEEKVNNVEESEETTSMYLSKLKGKSVLVIDDNETNCLVLDRQLTNWGMKVVTILNPLKALALLKKETFALIIVDYLMPDMDGVAFASTVSEHWPDINMPLILLSSVDKPPKFFQSESPIFSDIVTKPIRQKRLLKSIITALGLANIVKFDLEQKKDTAMLDSQFASENPLNILVAEDNPVNQKLDRMILNKLGYQPNIVANGIEVLEAVNRQPYDLIFMDIQMPEMDGLTATQEICARFQPEERPIIIAMTASAMQGDREMCLDAGMDDYLSKPIRFEQVKAMALKWGKKSMHQEGQNQKATESNDNLLDHETLETLQSFGQEMFEELIELYKSEASHNLTDIQIAIQGKDGEELRSASHSLKGSSYNLGAPQIGDMAAEFEIFGKQADFETAKDKLSLLKISLAQTIQALESVLNEAKE